MWFHGVVQAWVLILRHTVPELVTSWWTIWRIDCTMGVYREVVMEN
jgi:hypothetical protein